MGKNDCLLTCLFPFLLFRLENRVYEAGYFHAISRNSKLTVNLVHLYEKGRGECQTGQKSRAIEQIENFKADVVLLYTCFENIELILQQVNVVFSVHYILSVFICCCCFKAIFFRYFLD